MEHAVYAVGTNAGSGARVTLSSEADGKLSLTVWPQSGDDAGLVLNRRNVERLRDALDAWLAEGGGSLEASSTGGES